MELAIRTQALISAALDQLLKLTPLNELQYFVKDDFLDNLLSITLDPHIRTRPALADIINRTQGDLRIMIRERLLRPLTPEALNAVRGLLVDAPAAPMPLVLFNRYIVQLSQGGELTKPASETFKKNIAELMGSELARRTTNDFFFLHDLWKVTIQACRRDLNGATARLLFSILSEVLVHNPQADRRVRVMHHLYAVEMGVRLGNYQAALIQLDRVSLLNSELEDEQRIARAHLPHILIARLCLIMCHAAKIEVLWDGTETWPKGNLCVAVEAFKSLSPEVLTEECGGR